MDIFKKGAFLFTLVLLILSPAAYADTANCSATSGEWRWALGAGSRLDLTGSPNGSTNTYLDALRQTETTGTDPSNGSRDNLNDSMDQRFTTGPQPWATSYFDKKNLELTNFKNTTGSLSGGFTLDATCVPAGATINSVNVQVTHGVADANFGAYQARIRVLNGGSFIAFDLPNLVSAAGIANESGPDQIIVTSLLNTEALVNAAVIQFQAQRDPAPQQPSMLAILNEISLVVDYTPNGGGGGEGDVDSLVTGGGFVPGTYGGSNKTTANFGFNARSSSTGEASGTFEYNDGSLQLKGTVTQINACQPDSPTIGGGNFTFSGTFSARVGNTSKAYSGAFTVYVEDNGEPGRGSDVIRLTTSALGSWTGFATRTLSNGNIQFHFCDLP
jgi:hypothetical protein